MFNSKTLVSTLILVSVLIGTTFAGELEDNWDDFLHYTKIGRLDLAKDYANIIIESEPDAVALLGFVESNSQSYTILQKATQTPHDAELAKLSGQLLDIIL